MVSGSAEADIESTFEDCPHMGIVCVSFYGILACIESINCHTGSNINGMGV